MTRRPVDAAGDILPVRALADLVEGPIAAAEAAKARLLLARGDWWEDPDRGFALLPAAGQLRDTPEARQAAASYIAAFLQACPGVEAVEEVALTPVGRGAALSCRLRAAGGEAEIALPVSGLLPPVSAGAAEGWDAGSVPGI